MSSSKLALSAFALMLLTPYAFGHMEMVQPPPRRSKYNPTYTGNPDYDMISPLNAEKWPYPCRGYEKGGVVQTVKAGSSISVKLGGVAKHDGGHCQFAISYDDNTFVVLKDVYDDCLISSLDYSIQIPAGAPSGKATFAWAWINKIGNREYYMNCADIDIEGTADGSVSGPKLLVANLPGYPTIPEFGNGGYSGKDLFESRPNVKVTHAGSSEENPVPELKPTETIKPTETSKPVPTTDGGSSNCGDVPQWNSGTSYNGKDKVVYNNILWEAKWWTRNDQPGNNSQDVWASQGACDGKPVEPTKPVTSVEPTPTVEVGSGACSGIAEWRPNVAYNGEQKVVYNNRVWQAKWWSQNDKPGNNGPNVWVDLGAC
ncbi:hypothetical protein K493DRAFT_319760 [Basidiobolus meristosporus CBS 931.73]|uniref:Chitin-binding type-3 domain-containing protein n=1 Tax=Basidiobolus meristosporus CBS 931.73 TaxID=1314790 RepID=A0A1Y1XLT4_9FUNG|nr:hypothetical protein K493DRAFT_319760 [Basidiobolus meristosporus CBS 931.73]|eukprot:ORX86720.1 hypothetical protein K493DRAFT_319760 [Basidiobolus meristosporus CBS 931.73]